MSGFAKTPTNPFNSATAARSTPLFDFVPGRLVYDPTAMYSYPGYVDSFNNSLKPGETVNFYAYFSAYEGAGYDPNDVNFVERDDSGVLTTLSTAVTFPTVSTTGTNASPFAISLPPNPYTASLTNGTTATVFQKNLSFQIVSSGADGLYGLGGFYTENNSTTSLPFDSTSSSTPDDSIRLREADNLTNFSTQRLGR